MSEESIRTVYPPGEVADLLDYVIPVAVETLAIRRPLVHFFESDPFDQGDDTVACDQHGFAAYREWRVGVRLGLPASMTVHVLLHELSHLRQRDRGMRFSSSRDEEMDACLAADEIQARLALSSRYRYLVERVASERRPSIDLFSCIIPTCPQHWEGYRAS